MKNETRADKKFHRVLREYYRNELFSSNGKRVTDRERAIAIAFAEARRIDPKYHITKHANGAKIKIDNTLQIVFEDAWQHYLNYIASTRENTKPLSFEQWLRTTNEGLKYNKRMAQLIRYNEIIVEPQMNSRGSKIVGASHENGGVRGHIRETHEPIEVEGGELIITKNVGKIKQHITCHGEPEGIASRINELSGGDKISNAPATCHLKTEIMERGKKISSKQIWEYVAETKPFRGEGHIIGENVNDAYVVYSYGYYPILVYKDRQWYQNSEKYSRTTSKQKTIASRGIQGSQIEKTTSELEQLIGEKRNKYDNFYEKGTKIKSFLGIDEQSKIERQIAHEQQLKNNEMEHGKKIETNDVILKINEPREFAIVSFLTQKSFCELKLFKYDDICIYSGSPESMEELSKFMDAFNIHYTEFDNHFEFDDWIPRLAIVFCFDVVREYFSEF